MALVRAFSMIVNLREGSFEALEWTAYMGTLYSATVAA